MLGREATLFHDCTHSELTLRQLRNLREADLAPYGLRMDVFRFDGCAVDRVNLREQVVWSHPRSEFPALTEEQKDDGVHFDRVQMLAEDYLRMRMARVKKINLPDQAELG